MPLAAVLDRTVMAEYICAKAPKLQYLCGLIKKHVFDDGDKLLVWYQYPIEGWVLSILLKTLQIPHLTIGSQTGQKDRRRRLESFNDPIHSTKILLASAEVLSTGVNLQRGCHIMVMMSLAPNLNRHMQCLSRCHRVSQEHPQTVYVLSILQTYDQIITSKALKKMSIHLLGSADVFNANISEKQRQSIIRQAQEEEGDESIDPDWIMQQFKDAHLVAQVEDIMVQLLGMRCSRLHWDVPHLEPEKKATVGKTL